MKNRKTYRFSIDITLSDDMNTLACKSKTSVYNEILLAAMLAGAIVAISHDHSSDPHKFAEAICGTIMDRIDKPDIKEPNQQLS